MPLLCRNPLAQGVRDERQTDRQRKEMGESGGRGRKKEKKKQKGGRWAGSCRRREKAGGEINKTGRGDGCEEGRWKERQPAFTKSLDYMERWDKACSRVSVSDLLRWGEEKERGRGVTNKVR